jgi:F5/8 type C domain
MGKCRLVAVAVLACASIGFGITPSVASTDPGCDGKPLAGEPIATHAPAREKDLTDTFGVPTLSLGGDSFGLYTFEPGQTLATGKRYRLTDPSQAGRQAAAVQLARKVVLGAASLPGRLEDDDSERAAQQGAVWAAFGSIDLADSQIRDRSILDRATQLLDAAQQVQNAEESPTQVFGFLDYPTAYLLTAKEGEPHFASFDFHVSLTGGQGAAGLDKRLLTIETDGYPTTAQLTDEDGQVEISLPREGHNRDYTLKLSVPIRPGMLLLADSESTGLLTAWGGEINCMRTVTVSAPSFKERLENLEADFWDIATQPGNRAVLIIGVAVLVFIHFLLPLGRMKWGVAGVVLVGAAAWGLWLEAAIDPIPSPVSMPNNAVPTPVGKDRPVKMSADSEYPSTDGTHALKAAFDGDPKTAWVSAPGQGAGQLLALDFGRPVWITAIDLTNGYQDGDHYATNGRVDALQLLFDRGYYDEFEGINQGHWTHDLKQPMLTSHLVIRIKRYTPGWLSGAISELHFTTREATASELLAPSKRPPGYDEVMKISGEP